MAFDLFLTSGMYILPRSIPHQWNVHRPSFSTMEGCPLGGNCGFNVGTGKGIAHSLGKVPFNW